MNQSSNYRENVVCIYLYTDDLFLYTVKMILANREQWIFRIHIFSIILILIFSWINIVVYIKLINWHSTDEKGLFKFNDYKLNFVVEVKRISYNFCHLLPSFYRTKVQFYGNSIIFLKDALIWKETRHLVIT